MKPSDETMLKDSYDWERIKANAEEFIFINSDNDAWGCDEEQGRYLQNILAVHLFFRRRGTLWVRTI